ncbi:MAG: hypothetical protein GTO71_10370 [Woeseiaceae bacterium]|nr:hypothetical protein [Woeseiaceae bacterium]NIP21477.1 hypothetical protein [Woeseiaceae bacterium]NIS90465.1 hypothetical protein [Woeseiaceae bacterium]
MEGLWVPIAMFASLTVILSFFFWFRYRGRREMQQTIRSAIEKGQELTPELVESLGKPARPSKDKDLRYALVWLAIAIGFSAMGGAIGAAEAEEEVFLLMSGVAAFPFMLGLAYLIMWKFTERSQ